MRCLQLRVRYWSWRTLRELWRLCWRAAEHVAPVPEHWRRWWRLGQWLYHGEVTSHLELRERGCP